MYRCMELQNRNLFQMASVALLVLWVVFSVTQIHVPYGRHPSGMKSVQCNVYVSCHEIERLMAPSVQTNVAVDCSREP